MRPLSFANGPAFSLRPGRGVTPFVAIARQLTREGKRGKNFLICSNQTPADIICGKDLGVGLGALFFEE